VLDQGTIKARVFLDKTIVASGTGNLDGFVQFDPSTAQPLDFLLQSTDLLILAPALPGAYGAFDLDITITPGAGFGSSATGSNPYTIDIGPLDIGFSGVAFDPTAPVTVAPLAFSGVVSIDDLPITAFLTDGAVELKINAIHVVDVVWGTLAFRIIIDVNFFGTAVPEASVAGLLALGLGALALRARIR
jgi:hypothetical protein